MGSKAAGTDSIGRSRDGVALCTLTAPIASPCFQFRISMSTVTIRNRPYNLLLASHRPSLPRPYCRPKTCSLSDLPLSQPPHLRDGE